MTVQHPKRGGAPIAARLRAIPRKRASQALRDAKVTASAMQTEPPLAIPADDVFASIRRNRNTQLANQRAALALMDATEAALAARGLAAAPENYWSALLPVLCASVNDRVRASTAAYLLSLVAYRVPAATMCASYGAVYASIPRLVAEMHADAPFVRAAIAIVSASATAVLAAEASSVAEERPSLREMLRVLVSLAADARPKVRHSAQAALGVLYASPAVPAAWRSDAADAVVAVLCAATRREPTEALQAMPLARALLLGTVQGSNDDALVGAVTRVATLGNGPLAILALSALEARFSAMECSCDSALAALLAARPDGAAEVLPPWLAAVSALGARSLTMWTPAMTSVIDVLGSADASAALMNGAEDAASRLFASCTASEDDSDFASACDRLVRWLAVKGAPCAPHAIRLLGRAADALPSEWGRISHIVVSALGEAHDGRQGRHAALIEAALVRYVARFGPEDVVAALPLALDDDSLAAGLRPRAWMLAVLRDGTSGARMAFFEDALLPLVPQLRARADVHEASGRVGDAQTARLIAQHVWATLPAFMTRAVDVCEVLPRVAPAAADALSADVEARPAILAALAALAKTAADDETRAFLAEWAAPRIVPLLFNVFAATAPDARAGVVASLEAVLSALPAAARADFVQRVSARISQSDASDESQRDGLATLLELAAVLVRASSLGAHLSVQPDAQPNVLPHVPQNALGEALREMLAGVLRLVASLERSGDARATPLLKRAYRVLADVLERDDMASAVVDQYLPVLEDVLLPANASSSETPAAARRSRFRVLLRVVPLLPTAALHWVPLVLPEAVFGAKEANARTRALAFELVLALARRMAVGGVIRAEFTRGILSADASANLDEFLTMVVAGLAARTPHMVSATVLALARILYDLHSLMLVEGSSPAGSTAGQSAPLDMSQRRAQTLRTLLGDMVVLLACASREIVKAVLGFIKVALAVLPAGVFLETVAEDSALSTTADGQTLLAALVRGVLAWQGSHQMHFKERVRHLLERLVRRYGFDAVMAATPAEHVRLIHAIRKRREQARRRKERRSGEADEIGDEAGSGYTSAINGMPDLSGDAERASVRFEHALEDSSDGEQSDNDDALLDAVDMSLASADRSTLKNVRSASSAAKNSRIRAVAPQTDSDDDVAFDGAGKLVVRDDYAEDASDASDSEDGESAPAPKQAAKRNPRSDVRKRTDRFEPYAYVPLARSQSARGGPASARFFNRRR